MAARLCRVNDFDGFHLDNPLLDETVVESWHLGDMVPLEGPRWRTPGVNWIPETNTIVLIEPHVTADIVDEFTGELEFSLIGYRSLVGLVFHFKGPRSQFWGDAVCRAPQGEPGVPELYRTMAEDEQFVFSLVLVEAGTGIIRHMRKVTVSASFTKALLKETGDRWTRNVSEADALADTEAYEASFPTPQKAAKTRIARSSTVGLPLVTSESLQTAWAQRWSPALGNPADPNQSPHQPD